ncbi:MbcA/ParS/Xre antitoxin family protein [Paraburkholderia youngii]|uniref:MbcA/ParS/Xre antitoxin family protein n=1 Tax=Paraburkholderia youngii TaxID=2782701 RepID=UPI003D195C73
MSEIKTLAEEASGLYAQLAQTGFRAISALRSTDPELVDALLATFGSIDGAAPWLVSRTIGFGGSSALELLAQGARQRVMHVLNHLRYGLCT